MRMRSGVVEMDDKVRIASEMGNKPNSRGEDIVPGKNQP